MDVGRGLIPLVKIAARHLDFLPHLRALEHAGILVVNMLDIQARGHGFGDLLLGRPDVAQIDGLTIRARCQAAPCPGRCPPCRPGRRRRPAEGEARKLALTSGLMRPSKLRLPESTAAATRSLPVTALATSPGQRAAVTDAGGAAIGHQVEAQLRQRLEQARLAQIFGDDARARSQAGLDVGLDRQSLLNRFLCQQSRANHHRRIGGIGAGGDGRDDHRAVLHLHRAAVRAEGGFRFRRLPA